jgi:hypothetical protein
MLREELAIGVDCVGAAGVLPVPLLAKLRNPRARLRCQLAFGMAP